MALAVIDWRRRIRRLPERSPPGGKVLAMGVKLDTAAALPAGCCSQSPPRPHTNATHDNEVDMTLEGGCYCGRLRYQAEGEPLLRAQCHCRACQYISGGAPNLFILMPTASFRWTTGSPKQFARSDLDNPVTREFCAECGTHLTTRRPGFDAVIVKVGTLDDPSRFGAPAMAIFTAEKQAFHDIPAGMPAFAGLPTR